MSQTQWKRRPLNPTKHDPDLKMTAVEWHGANDVRVNAKRPVPLVTDPEDVIVKITSTNICGSDLHLYVGAFPGMEKGDVMGHEGMGIVKEVGPEVTSCKVGDRVVIPFDMGCGACMFCEQKLYSLCDSTNPSAALDKLYGDRISGMYGYTHLCGGWEGEQAEYVRVPFANTNTLKIPADLVDQRVCFLSDIFPTAWHGTVLGDVAEGDTVGIWGCGPVGILAAMICKYKKAKRVVMIDNQQYRLDFAQTKLGVETLNFDQIPKGKDVPEVLKEMLPPHGPDVGIEMVGMHYSKEKKHLLERKVGLETDPSDTVNEIIKGVRKGGRISVIGAYAGFSNHFNLGALMEKHMQFRGGQCPVQKYWKELLQLIKSGELHPEIVITHEPTLDKAPAAYEVFNKKLDGCIKVKTMGKSEDAYAPRQESRPQHLSAEPLPKFHTKSSEPFRAVNVWKRAKEEVVRVNNKAKWHLHAKEIDIKRWRNTKGW